MRSAERSSRCFTSLLCSSRTGPTRLPCISHSLFRPNVDIAALRALIGCLHVRGKLWAVWRWSAKQVIGQLLLLKLHDSTCAKTNTLCEYLRHVHILGPSRFRHLVPAPRVLEPQQPRCKTLRACYGCSTHLRQLCFDSSSSSRLNHSALTVASSLFLYSFWLVRVASNCTVQFSQLCS